ncbi:GNAT family N-acetyltransferase [Paracoccus sp. R12_1]|jgi:ribosomal protein S18 acetylase RimI-like enzyme|uniref:GNAT family N-acetyltransferase n=1 Tax=unclassified Paracoccus (in: a-proteobacteria) TaxID=2688777 RepID=UPI001ADB9F00|nr:MULTISPECIES: GNAT family N-acetyltransferase [unclassified Paracoccus (in: a-proteobacteria)]MBO9453837.1 GNAT family N-acetyltransferase [Paracoccus sp. R12_2]MBO9486739.1 GNAT family N-acetyltransferase [Paracoccus sp. R12_1]
MRNQRQDHPLQIVSPVPDAALSQAARLWWGATGHGWGPPPRVRACHGMVALDDTGGVAGVIGLRDAQGGFPAATPLGARIAFRAAPATADLVVDGIVVRDARQGIGSALLRQALVRAASAGHPGLRAEVRVQNSGAMEFYRAMGFVPVAQGRFGWPWTGQVAILRRVVDDLPDVGFDGTVGRRDRDVTAARGR